MYLGAIDAAIFRGVSRVLQAPSHTSPGSSDNAKWKRERKAEALEDARKVMTGDIENPRTSQIAAVSAFKSYKAASLVAEHMWVFIISEGKEAPRQRTRQKGKESKCQRCLVELKNR